MSRAYEKAKLLSIKADCGWDEKFIQHEIERDPSILGLGALKHLHSERRGPHGGRLDLLLSDEQGTCWYEVEIQLWKTNPDHIVRTIEYWDIERRRHPEYEHKAVIVAEEIDGRYFNVISLFSQTIPLIALKISAVAVGEKATLVFTRVVDFLPRSTDKELLETKKPEYWEQRSSARSMAAINSLLEIAKTISPSMDLRYGKNDIFLEASSSTVLRFWPKRKFVKMELPSVQSSATEESLSDAGIDLEGGYDPKLQGYVLVLMPEDEAIHRSLLSNLIRAAFERSSVDDR